MLSLLRVRLRREITRRQVAHTDGAIGHQDCPRRAPASPEGPGNWRIWAHVDLAGRYAIADPPPTGAAEAQPVAIRLS